MHEAADSFYEFFRTNDQRPSLNVCLSFVVLYPPRAFLDTLFNYAQKNL